MRSGRPTGVPVSPLRLQHLSFSSGVRGSVPTLFSVCTASLCHPKGARVPDVTGVHLWRPSRVRVVCTLSPRVRTVVQFFSGSTVYLCRAPRGGYFVVVLRRPATPPLLVAEWVSLIDRINTQIHRYFCVTWHGRVPRTRSQALRTRGSPSQGPFQWWSRRRIH